MSQEHSTNSVMGVDFPDNALLDLNFKKYMDESIKLKKRHHLPNIKDYPSFLSDLLSNGYQVSIYSHDNTVFKPTQSEVNNKKVDNIVKKYKNGDKLNPITVTQDNYIVDGHHRYYASLVVGDTVKVEKINCDYKEILKFIKDKPYVVYINKNDGVVR